MLTSRPVSRNQVATSPNPASAHGVRTHLSRCWSVQCRSPRRDVQPGGEPCRSHFARHPFSSMDLGRSYEHRYAMAASPDVLRAVVAIFHSEVFRVQRRQAKKLGEPHAHTAPSSAFKEWGG